jgi:3-oxoadipate enol-lactonase
MPEPKTKLIGPAPRIAVDHAGNGPLVIFLHGIGGNRSNWTEQVRHLSNHFTAVAWDARGWGGSDEYEGELSFSDFAADLIRVMDHFSADRAHLIGLSMGGRISLDFYGRHPERVRSLVLTASSAGMHEMMEKAARQKFLDDRRRPLVEGGTTADMAQKVAPGLVSPKASAAVRQRAIDSLSALRKESYLKALSAVTWYEEFPPFETVRVPTLVVSGTDDYLCPPDIAREMARKIPGARHVLLEDCGHLVNLEYPERYNEIITEFLLQVEQSAPDRSRLGVGGEAAAGP